MTAPARGIALQRGLAALRAGRPEEAIAPLRQALAEEGASSLAAPNLALALMDAGRAAEAREALAAALLRFPHLPELHVRMGQLALQRNESAAARGHFDAALRWDVAHVPALAGLAAVALAEGDPDAARALLAEARLHDPADPGLRLKAIEARLAAGDAAGAETEAIAAAAGVEHSVAAGLLRARAALARRDPAMCCEQLAEELARQPVSAAAAAALAAAQRAAGRAGEALSHWRLAEAVGPQDGDARLELGLSLYEAGARKEATEALERAAALRPDEFRWRMPLADLRVRAHRYGAAAALHEDTLAGFGRDPGVLSALALVRCSQGQQSEAVALAEEAGFRPDLAAVLLGGLLPYGAATGTAVALNQAAERLKRALARDASDLPPRARAPRDRLRVGFLSGSFGTHPVGWLTVAGIEALPRDGFEVVLLSLKTLDGALARRFRARADRWVDLDPGLGERALVEALRAEDLDVLVDLGGHGSGGRIVALRHRAAPVQIKWVGSQSGPTGVPNIDWMLADRWEIPADLERHYTEPALRLRDGYVCYAPPSYAPAVAPLPALRKGHVTFGCFNNLAKVTPQVLGAWARILAAIPDARLVLRTHALGDDTTREMFVARAAAAGLDPTRLDLHGTTPHEALLAAYGEVDIALDPFPYAGGLTVCEALWMGVPVIGLAGTSFAGRHALSHLSNCGLADWVAESEEDYVTQAIRRARDLAGLAAMRAELRARVAASPLCDAKRFGESLAEALHQAWSRSARA